MALHLSLDSELPDGGVSWPKLVIALDIDGVLSRQLDEVEIQQMPDDYSALPFGAAWVDDHRGSIRLLHTAPAVIVELDEIVQTPGVQLVWLTSEAPWLLPRAVELAFGGRLSGGLVISDRHRASNWKMSLLIAHLRSVGDPPYVWADDTAIQFAFRASPRFREGGLGPSARLLVQPDPAVGLTLDDIEDIRDFVRGLGLNVRGGKA